MPRAILFERTGGPEVMEWREVEVGPPAKGELRLRHTAIGLNYIDTYHRAGSYPLPLPSGLGVEAAGIVEAKGAGVRDFKVGDRVGYCLPPVGAYSDVRLMPADRVIKLPPWLSDAQAAGALLKGMTAEYLLRRTYRVSKGDVLLVHAAAGGVGLILCQWAKALGAIVIGTVGSEEKAKLARAHGCRHPIVYGAEDFVARVKEITRGRGVKVVYDGVGKDTFLPSLDCLMPRGFMVSFGSASGPVPPFSPGLLSQKGSLYLTRPTLFDYTRRREELLASARALFAMIKGKKVKIEINQTYPLREAAQAHRDLEARKTTGSTLLLP
jgi:NADPH2:quinone reductase